MRKRYVYKKHIFIGLARTPLFPGYQHTKEWNKIWFVWLLILFQYTCGEGKIGLNGAGHPARNVKQHCLKLVDSLGKVNFNIPGSFDTCYSWVDYSDCGKPCDKQNYRYQSKEMVVVKEWGILSTKMIPETYDWLTISHSRFVPFWPGNTKIDSIRHDHLRNNILTGSKNPKVIFDTIERFDNRYFSIFDVARSDSGTKSEMVMAITKIRHNEISFTFEVSVKSKDSIPVSFFSEAHALVRTIRFSQGP